MKKGEFRAHARARWARGSEPATAVSMAIISGCCRQRGLKDDQHALEVIVGVTKAQVEVSGGITCGFSLSTASSAWCALGRAKGQHGEPIDPDRLMVRARVRSHLDALTERLPDLLGTCEIVDSRSTDYAYRMFVEKRVWARALSTLAEETDYDNFKSAVARHQGPTGAAYEHSLHEVWAVMHRLQRAERP